MDIQRGYTNVEIPPNSMDANSIDIPPPPYFTDKSVSHVLPPTYSNACLASQQFEEQPPGYTENEKITFIQKSRETCRIICCVIALGVFSFFL